MDWKDLVVAGTFSAGWILLAIAGPTEFQPVVFTGFSLTVVGMGAVAFKELNKPDTSHNKVNGIGLLILGHASIFFEAAEFVPYEIGRPITLALFAVGGMFMFRTDSPETPDRSGPRQTAD